MNVTFSTSEDCITAKIVGSLTESNQQQLKSVFDHLLAAPEKTVDLDLSGVPLMGSTGIGKLIILHRALQRTGRTMRIVSIHEELYGFFASMRLGLLLDIPKPEVG